MIATVSDVSRYKTLGYFAGCQCPNKLGGKLLNSRTYNIVLETHPYTCSNHRNIRKIERHQIQKVKKGLQQTCGKRLLERPTRNKVAMKRAREKKSVYDFTSDTNDEISPSIDDDDDEDDEPNILFPQRAKLRRRRIPYTEEEEENLIEGVRRMGKHWNQILVTYKFHPSRTNVDLMDKYKRIVAAGGKGISTVPSTSRTKQGFKPFSMCEERRLRRGIKQCGYNWKIILQSFTFAKGRTTEDLRNRWRSMHRRR